MKSNVKLKRSVGSFIFYLFKTVSSDGIAVSDLFFKIYMIPLTKCSDLATCKFNKFER